MTLIIKFKMQVIDYQGGWKLRGSSNLEGRVDLSTISSQSPMLTNKAQGPLLMFVNKEYLVSSFTPFLSSFPTRRIHRYSLLKHL